MAISLKTLIATGGSNVPDNREFKNWQDWVGNSGDSHIQIGQATRVVNGVSTARRPGGSATFTVPSGVTKVRVTCIGGGGGGGNYSSTYYGGKGGGGGCFASGEYDVTPGQQLSVTVGQSGGGHKGAGGYGGNGGTSSVTDSATGGSNIAVSAAGGSGGYYQSSGGGGGSSHSISGNSLISGSSLGGHGGQAGDGSSNAFGFGPEGYAAGGGGAAGSFLGAGYRGGHGTNGGYSYASGGGGGIGGEGGTGYGSNTSSQYDSHAGGGGGSAGAGRNGDNNSSSWHSWGGPGRYTQAFTADFNDGTKSAAGEFPDNWSSGDALMVEAHGARHGDGETDEYQLRDGSGSSSNQTDLSGSTYIRRGPGGTSGGSLGNYDQFNTSGAAEGETEAPQSGTKSKSFNGVLGRLWGGGGAGAPCRDDNFGHYNHSGGDGGTGAGGGGGAGITTNWNSGERNQASYTNWDWTNLAFRSRDSAWHTNNYRLNGMGGNGGALGGGGGSAAYAHGGAGGIGGGGGGGGGHYSGGSYYGNGGCGGPGYVLIEW